ncbi:LIM domain-binding protein 2 [Habropoda laboriosa]|uniref:LIM domain-binding protein 2 n=1 Tax=Habropoda laboriosa TaxID=597456 RepID=A0A0L7RHN0_9HYME|nr:LIM domain-binding protein 2 [Habropoda laboriosa]
MVVALCNPLTFTPAYNRRLDEKPSSIPPRSRTDRYCSPPVKLQSHGVRSKITDNFWSVREDAKPFQDQNEKEKRIGRQRRAAREEKREEGSWKGREEESDNLWWDAFATEFFEDDATLTLTFCLEDGPKRYTIGRTLIPRYFRSIFEGGVTELYYNLKHPKESFHNTSITLDCDNCVMVTHHGKPMFTKVCTEGRLILEFTFDDLMRIKSWHMSVRTHKELVPRTVVGMQQDPTMLEQLSKNITRQGITNSTLNYLRLCVILEPMQELMSRHKAYALSPRDCLKTTLFQKWQRMVAPPGKRESQRPANKRRKRKASASGPGNNAPPAPSKKRSPGPNFALASQDVMVVGEPSLMGGDFGEEDERLITRLENTQYDAANSLDPHSHDTPGGPPPHPHQFHSEPTPGNSWPPDRGPGPPQGGPGSQGVQGGQGGAAAGVQGTQDASQQQQDKKSPALGHAAAAAATAASMGMESSELVAVAHYQAQQLQRQLLAEQSGLVGTMLPPAAQPAGGGLTQPSLQQPQHAQSQGQDPLQSLMQQLICLQQIEYFLAQRGHK